MKVEIGTKGVGNTWQQPFPEQAKCRCGGDARLAFVASENEPGEEHVCNLHKNEPNGEGFWPHDAIAMAVYFCGKCFEPVVLWNQA